MIPASMVKTKPRKEHWNFVELLFFAAFVLWSAAGMFSTVEHVTPRNIGRWSVPGQYIPFVDFCLQNGDMILILLAVINTHLHAVRQWTSPVARNWGLLIIVCAYLIESFGTYTTFPFGNYHYTDRFGPKLYLVPLTIPFAWFVVVTNSLFVVRSALPHSSRLMEIVLTALLCTLYDFVLEPFATTVKQYWIWADGAVPPINYLAWFLISCALVFLFAPTLFTRFKDDPRPVLILGLTVMIFLVGISS